MRVGNEPARHRRRDAAGLPVPGPDGRLESNQTTRTTSRTSHNFFAVGRLKPGVSLEQRKTS